MLDFPVPEAEYITISTEPSEAQKEMVQELAACAEEVRNGNVKSTEDNMLKITSDGRKLALDQRIGNPLLPDDPGSKVNACVENVFNIWRESAEALGTQLILGYMEKLSQLKPQHLVSGKPAEQATYYQKALVFMYTINKCFNYKQFFVLSELQIHSHQYIVSIQYKIKNFPCLYL